MKTEIVYSRMTLLHVLSDSEDSLFALCTVEKYPKMMQIKMIRSFSVIRCDKFVNGSDLIFCTSVSLCSVEISTSNTYQNCIKLIKINGSNEQEETKLELVMIKIVISNSLRS